MVSSLMGLSSSGYGVIMSAGRSVMTEATLFDTVINRLGGRKKIKTSFEKDFHAIFSVL